MNRRVVIGLYITVIVIVSVLLLFLYIDKTKVGQKIDSYKGVSVYYNGFLYTKSYGRNYSNDGYYYGWKWQCVEFIKRFYYDELGHKMPDVYGNAKDYFDKNLEQGQLNKKRNLVQFKNGGNEKPQQDDLVVFCDSKYGHVAIVTEVTDQSVEIVQQNIYGKTREKYSLKNVNGNWFVGTNRTPAGWLRKSN